MKKAGLISVIFLALLIGCFFPNLKDVPREKCVQMPDDNVMAALHDNCIRCHTKDFNTKDEVCGLRGRIIEQVRTGKMPKIGKLYPSYFKTIVDWK